MYGTSEKGSIAMKKINVAIVGMGFIGKLHYDALRRLPFVHIRTLVVHKEQDIPAVRDAFDADIVTACWQDAVADPQIQVIHNCTPNALHDAVNLAAITAGKHIYAEKPTSLTSEGAEKILRAATEAGEAHAINHQYRMNAAVLEMRGRIRNAEAGRPLYVGGHYLQESVARATDYTPRRIPETSPARAVLDIGVHWADTASFVMGVPIKKVYAKMYIHHPVRTDPTTGKAIHVRSDDTTAIMVEFADGTPGSALFSKCMLGHKNDLAVTVSGDKREYAWYQERCDLLYVGNRETGNEVISMDKAVVLPETSAYLFTPAGHAPGWQDAQKNAMLAFYRSIEDGSYLTGNVPYATFADGVMGNRFVDACLTSAKQDKWIDL